MELYHKAALEYGVKVTGATVHFVTLKRICTEGLQRRYM